MSDNWNPGQPSDSPYGSPGGGYTGPNGGGYGSAGSGYGEPYGGGYSGPSGGYPGYGPPGGYPPPPGFYTQAPPNSGSAIGALVTGILLMLSCCGVFAIVGVIFSALAIGEKQDHEKHARYTRNAWIANAVNVGLIALIALCFVLMVVLDL